MSAWVAGAIAVLAGCSAPPEREPLALRDAPALSPGGPAELTERWWTVFGDAELDARIERALDGNFTLDVAWERLSAARALERRARAGLVPSVDAFAEGELRAGEQADGRDFDPSSRVGLGLAASYEVDLWGRVRALAEADRLRADATEADLRAAAVGLSAELALTWFELAEARRQVELVASQLETNGTVLQVLETRFSVGQSDSADVLRQRQLVEATREQAIVTAARVELLVHRMAVLEGRAPQAVAEAPAARLPADLPQPATGLTSDLLERRPDVRGAWLRLEAADADVAAAVRDRYPRLDLSASLSTVAERPADLFEDWLATLGGQLVGPLLDGGRRRAEVDRTLAVRRQRLAQYGEVVLVAFQEVEDALVLEAAQARRERSLAAQLALSESTVRQLRTQYLNGAADFVDVLIALREQQGLERDLLGAELERLAARVALHRALAGGFELPREALAAAREEPRG